MKTADDLVWPYIRRFQRLADAVNTFTDVRASSQVLMDEMMLLSVPKDAIS